MSKQGRWASLRYVALAICVGLFSVFVNVFLPYVFEDRTLLVAITASLFVLGIVSIVALIWRAGRR